MLCLVYSKEGGSSFGVSNVGAVLAFHCHCVCMQHTGDKTILRFTCVFNTKVTILETKTNKRVNLWPHYSLHRSIFNGSVCVYSSFHNL